MFIYSELFIYFGSFLWYFDSILAILAWLFLRYCAQIAFFFWIMPKGGEIMVRIKAYIKGEHHVHFNSLRFDYITLLIFLGEVHTNIVCYVLFVQLLTYDVCHHQKRGECECFCVSFDDVKIVCQYGDK